MVNKDDYRYFRLDLQLLSATAWFFHFLSVSHQIDIRAAKCLENFMCSENNICTLFENKADSNLKTIFYVRGNTTSLQF